jgi:hypothetical protein
VAKKAPAKAGKKGPAKGASKKAGKRAGGGAKGAAPAIPGNPERVTTGPGASPEELGRRIVAEFNKGRFDVIEPMWSPSIVSIEGGGMAWRGRKNVDAKNSGWMSENRVAGAAAEGPYVGSTGFAIKFRMEIEEIKSGRRTLMEEVGVYTVKNGKIVQEEFMYGSMRPADTMASPEPAAAAR